MCLSSPQRATSGFNVAAAHCFVCKSIQLRKHTRIQDNPPYTHAHTETVMYEVQWRQSCTAGHTRPQEPQHWCKSATRLLCCVKTEFRCTNSLAYMNVRVLHASLCTSTSCIEVVLTVPHNSRIFSLPLEKTFFSVSGINSN